MLLFAPPFSIDGVFCKFNCKRGDYKGSVAFYFTFVVEGKDEDCCCSLAVAAATAAVELFC